MKLTELQRVYQRTAATFKKNPTEAEADAWKANLLPASVADVEAALERHADDMTFDEFIGKPRCTIMPSPAELKYAIAKWERDAQTIKAGRFVPCEREGCFEGWVRVKAGKWLNAQKQVARNDAVRPCQCRLEYVALKKGS